MAIMSAKFRATLTKTTNQYLAPRLPLEGVVQIVETGVSHQVIRTLFMPDPEPGNYTSFVSVPDAEYTFTGRV